MSKVKMRCNTCGKWFQSANAKEITCPDCMQKARKEKLAAKTTPPTGEAGAGTSAPPRSVAPPPPKPKPASSETGHWLDTLNDVKVGRPDEPIRPKIPSSPAPRDNRSGPDRDRDRVGIYRGPSGPSGPGGPGNYRDDRDRGFGGPGTGGYRDREREGGNRAPGNFREGGGYKTPYRVGGGMGLPDTAEPRPRQPMEGGRGPRPGAPGEGHPEGFRKEGRPKNVRPKTPKPPAPPKPKRERIPPPPPFEPTPEQVAQVEARYQELATPVEFDGIRTQIAQELSIPKSAIKKIVKEYRDREHIPSWWEAQTYKGNEEEMEKIKALYIPLLPLPDVGVHKKIAEDLSLKPGDIYQAIKKIRLDMNLPQFNDPALHGIELRPPKKKAAPEQAEAEAQSQEQASTPAQEPKSATSEEPAATPVPEPSAVTIVETPQETIVAVLSEGNEPDKELGA